MCRAVLTLLLQGTRPKVGTETHGRRPNRVRTPRMLC